MTREQKIELLISLLNQMKVEEREEVISLIIYTVQTQGHHPGHHPTAD